MFNMGYLHQVLLKHLKHVLWLTELQQWLAELQQWLAELQQWLTELCKFVEEHAADCIQIC